MLTFNLKKEWFEKIKSGEKTHEYREVKPYWTSRFDNFLNHYQIMGGIEEGTSLAILDEDCEFVCGYAAKTEKHKRLKGKIINITVINGLNTDLKVDKPVFDIEFELIKKEK